MGKGSFYVLIPLDRGFKALHVRERSETAAEYLLLQEDTDLLSSGSNHQQQPENRSSCLTLHLVGALL